jgi:NAD(P)H dehydrogenase (quinone)
MYAITGITGQIGSVIGDILLASDERLRAVVRNADKGQPWKKRGCEVALATIEDAASLAAAFRGVEAVFCPGLLFIAATPSQPTLLPRSSRE